MDCELGGGRGCEATIVPATNTVPGLEDGGSGEKERGGMVVVNGVVILGILFIGPLLCAPHGAIFGIHVVLLNLHVTLSLVLALLYRQEN